MKFRLCYFLLCILSAHKLIAGLPTAPPPKSKDDHNTQTNMIASAPLIAAAEPKNNPLHDIKHKKLGVFVAGGITGRAVDVIQLGLTYQLDKIWQITPDIRATPHTTITTSYWKGNKGKTGTDSLFDLGFSLFSRFMWTKPKQATPFIDLGVGLHYLTERNIESTRLGQPWQAGTKFGAGIIIGGKHDSEIGIQYRHLSNGGVADNNHGSDQLLIKLQHRF